MPSLTHSLASHLGHVIIGKPPFCKKGQVHVTYIKLTMSKFLFPKFPIPISEQAGISFAVICEAAEALVEHGLLQEVNV